MITLLDAQSHLKNSTLILDKILKRKPQENYVIKNIYSISQKLAWETLEQCSSKSGTKEDIPSTKII